MDSWAVEDAYLASQTCKDAVVAFLKGNRMEA